VYGLILLALMMNRVPKSTISSIVVHFMLYVFVCVTNDSSLEHSHKPLPTALGTAHAVV
jgi:hypothetical protein